MTASGEVLRLQEKADVAYSEGYADGYKDCRRNLTSRVVESLSELSAELEANAQEVTESAEWKKPRPWITARGKR